VRLRDQILAAAAELFATAGHAKTSMRDLATASGIWPAAFTTAPVRKKQSRSNWSRTTRPA
jgi:hypothetical protein